MKLILKEIYMVEMKCFCPNGKSNKINFCIAVDDDPEIAREFAKSYFDDLKESNNWIAYEITSIDFIYDSVYM